MKCVIIFGPLAVGKMTVGQELEKITDLKLFHNHMTIEMVLPFFDMKSPSFKRIVKAFRIKMFEEIAKSDLAGVIFTFVWKLDSKNDCDFIDTIVKIFEQENAIVCYVELDANVAERLNRNTSPNRLKNKPSKSNYEESELELLETDEKHVLNSKENEFNNMNHLRVENTNLSADRVARMIKEEFDL
jgi:hypothetical protein